MLILMKMKTAMLAGALAAPILATAFAPAPPHDQDGALRLASTSFSYRAAGDFSQAGRPVEGPLRELRLPADLVIMKRQVTVAEYARCVDEAACPRIAVPAGAQDVPVVGVSWHDASAYAAWVSRKTGITHRLPTDEEWTFAAAEKARDEAMPLVDPADPAQAWIARYEAESARSRPAATAAQPGGTFGTNSNGLDDLAGNVWEWTNSCFVRVSLDGGARADHQHQLRRPRRGGSPSLLYDRLHPRSQVRRLRRGRPAGQSRLQARRRTLPVGRHIRRPERREAAAANIDAPAIGGGLSQRKVLPPRVR